MDAGNGTNSVQGDDGNDTITTGTGTDSIQGGNGNDTIRAGTGINRQRRTRHRPVHPLGYTTTQCEAPAP
ncbi:hypothetical protein [Streptomyces sp. NBC_01614]|uniref:hypothetical protein n=1 Tax=Streptomyces sp. NBC_01614 TaxID=2975897 RepID=UPI00386E6658